MADMVVVSKSQSGSGQTNVSPTNFERSSLLELGSDPPTEVCLVLETYLLALTTASVGCSSWKWTRCLDRSKPGVRWPQI